MEIEWHSAKSPEQMLDEKDAEIERLKDAIWKALAQQGYWGTRTEEICSDLRAALAKKEDK